MIPGRLLCHKIPEHVPACTESSRCGCYRRLGVPAIRCAPANNNGCAFLFALVCLVLPMSYWLSRGAPLARGVPTHVYASSVRATSELRIPLLPKSTWPRWQVG